MCQDRWGWRYSCLDAMNEGPRVGRTGSSHTECRHYARARRRAMANQEEGLQLCVFLLETMYHNHKPLYEVIVEMARREGLAGATVFRGMESYGMDHLLHTNRLVDLSVDLP